MATAISTAGGTDLVQTTLGSYALPNYLENLQYIGSGTFTGTGNGVANKITGGSGDDRVVDAEFEDVDAPNRRAS